MGIREPIYRNRRLESPALDTAKSLASDEFHATIYASVYISLIAENYISAKIKEIEKERSLLAAITILKK